MCLKPSLEPSSLLKPCQSRTHPNLPGQHPYRKGAAGSGRYMQPQEDEWGRIETATSQRMPGETWSDSPKPQRLQLCPCFDTQLLVSRTVGGCFRYFNPTNLCYFVIRVQTNECTHGDVTPPSKLSPNAVKCQSCLNFS